MNPENQPQDPVQPPATPEPVAAPVPQPQLATNPMPPAQQPVAYPGPSQAAAPTAGIDAKIMSLKYMAIVVPVSIIGGTIYNVSKAYGRPFLAICALAIFIYAFTVVSKVKTRTNSLTQQDKKQAVILMSLDPLIVQAVYYYRLKKNSPNEAKIFNSIGWNIFFVQLVFYIAIAIIVAVAATPSVAK
jgi:energy-coupling factor transporter transmembrane protein EcfT